MGTNAQNVMLNPDARRQEAHAHVPARKRVASSRSHQGVSEGFADANEPRLYGTSRSGNGERAVRDEGVGG